MEPLADYARCKTNSNIRYIIWRGEGEPLQSGRHIDGQDYRSCGFLFSSRGTYKLSPRSAICSMVTSAWDTGHRESWWDRGLEAPLAGLSVEKHQICFKNQYIKEPQKLNPTSHNLLKFRQSVV